MSINTKIIKSSDCSVWDDYVKNHSQATLYHLSGWQRVNRKTYGHKTYYLMATKEELKAQSSKDNCITTNQQSAMSNELNSEKVSGILPLIHLKHILLDNSLISIPFCDMGGILTNDEEAEIALITDAIKLADELGAKNIELRNTKSIQWFNNFDLRNIINANFSINSGILSHKVRMILRLPESSETLMKFFKSKLRSQIKKPLREGLKSKIGGVELLDDFYKVFSTNMRDLGSPVHSKSLLRTVIEEFSEDAKVVIVFKKIMPVACSIIIGFKDTLENPWASSLREFSKLSPNMLLYWSMLEYGCDNGFKYFDFGRCSPGSGTYRFKEQWGAKPEPLYWHYISLDGKPIDDAISKKFSFDFAAQVWRKLPVPVTRVIGPMIRKYIGL